MTNFPFPNDKYGILHSDPTTVESIKADINNIIKAFSQFVNIRWMEFCSTREAFALLIALSPQRIGTIFIISFSYFSIISQLTLFFPFPFHPTRSSPPMVTGKRKIHNYSGVYFNERKLIFPQGCFSSLQFLFSQLIKRKSKIKFNSFR